MSRYYNSRIKWSLVVVVVWISKLKSATILIPVTVHYIINEACRESSPVQSSPITFLKCHLADILDNRLLEMVSVEVDHLRGLG
jgi:hypothetical protein